MFRKIEDFIQTWDDESKSTLKLYNNLTNESLAQKVSDAGRTLLLLARHINYTVTELPNTAGLPIEINHSTTHTVEELIKNYQNDCKHLAQIVKANWTDDQLVDEIPMYGETWKKGAALYILIAHQAHHRGQLTILMRQAGILVPGIYGPAKEEWQSMGMDAQE